LILIPENIMEISWNPLRPKNISTKFVIKRLGYFN